MLLESIGVFYKLRLSQSKHKEKRNNDFEKYTSSESEKVRVESLMKVNLVVFMEKIEFEYRFRLKFKMKSRSFSSTTKVTVHSLVERYSSSRQLSIEISMKHIPPVVFEKYDFETEVLHCKKHFVFLNHQRTNVEK